MTLSDELLLRFSRQLLVPSFDLAGQEKLAAARILIVGCGGLGTPAAMYLAAAWVGSLVLVDDDRVDLSNLPRQVAYGESDVSVLKVEALAHRLRAMNAGMELSIHACRVESSSVDKLMEGVDLVIDATDNREARLLIDSASARLGIPWFMGAAVQLAGQNIAFSPTRTEGCYHCLSPDQASMGGACSELGILGPVVGVVALNQVLDALGFLTGCKPVPWGVVRFRDFSRDEQFHLSIEPQSDCEICGFKALRGSGDIRDP